MPRLLHGGGVQERSLRQLKDGGKQEWHACDLSPARVTVGFDCGQDQKQVEGWCLGIGGGGEYFKKEGVLGWIKNEN